MLAAYCAEVSDDPLAGLHVGDLSEPPRPPGWATVRVEAASINHHDLFTLRGRSSQPVRPPQILGCDAAGVVEDYDGTPPPDAPPPGSPVVVYPVISCGACAACRRGEGLFCSRFGLPSEGEYPGTLAERVHVPAGNVLRRPDGLDAVAAACLPTAYLTAYRMLFTRARLQPGDSVLVQGAGGGVATAVILIGRATGLRVLVTSRDPARGQAAVDLGAERAFTSGRETAAEVTAATGGGVDAVIETVGEPTWETSLRAVRPGGTIVVAGATAGGNPPARLQRVFWNQLSIVGSTMGTRAEMERVLDLAASGAVRPLVDSTHPLARAAEGFRRVWEGDMLGKVVVRP